MPAPTPSLDQQIQDTRAAAIRILDRADADKRGLNTEEKAEYDRLDAELDGLLAQRERSWRQAAAKAGRPGPAPARGDDGAAALETEFDGFALGTGGPWGRVLSGREPRRTVLRPGTPERQRATPAYRAAFLAYLKGEPSREQLGLQVAKDDKGGYLAPHETSTQLIQFLDNNVFMRQLATVLPPLGQAVSLGIPSWETDPNDADWSPEVPASDISEDTAAAVGRRELMPHLLTKMVKVSRKLLRASVVDPLDLLIQRLGYKFAVTEEQAYLTGTGDQQPLGVFVASDNGVPTSRDVTASSATAFVADDLIDLLYSLKEQYQRNATGLFSREAVKRARKLKDGSGQYLWMPGLGGQPSTILDRPYVMSEYVPSTFTTGLYVGMFADFKAGYWIADALALEIQQLNELFALKNQVGVVARKETDGMPVLAEAFARLKLA